MTRTIEPSRAAFGAEWRAHAAAAQDAALPPGRVLVSCPAPLGVGGLGRHLLEIARALERLGRPSALISEDDGRSAAPSAGAPALAFAERSYAALAPLVRCSPSWRMWRASVAFDVHAARRLERADHLIGFNGSSLTQFSRAAAQRPRPSLLLVSATAHVRRLLRQHALAYGSYPLERSWAAHLSRRTLREYAQAERIYVSSSYVRDSFADEGVPEEKLSLFALTPDPRFAPAGSRTASDAFEIVYVGGLTVDKGVPLLIDAVRALRHADLRLVLVGGPKSRGMRRFLERALAADPRIEVRAGPPLERLREACLCVHAAYSDGFAYAPAEAMACGVPVIVSEDTGMKDLIESPRSGLIVPTGDRAALTEAIDAAYRGEIFGG